MAWHHHIATTFAMVLVEAINALARLVPHPDLLVHCLGLQLARRFHTNTEHSASKNRSSLNTG